MSTHMNTYFVDNLLPFAFDLLITCSHVYLLWWSHVPMFTYFDVHVFLCSHASMLICSFVYLWLHTHSPVCLRAYMLGLFDDYLLLCWNALMITCSHALIFTCLRSTHMCTRGSWNVYWLGGISDCVVGRTCTQMLKWLCLNVEDIGRLEECILRCLNAHMLIWSHDHMLVCSYG